ncbi:MAG TPA: TetR/AcrR family transcriptional regulator [Solirubrobacteraceae bacterium]|jgi:AcrR family transcriptional regulator
MGGARQHPQASRKSGASHARELADTAPQAGDILSVQRARLLSAAVGLLAEEGHEAFSAAAICARAGVSRRTFYEIFHDREACLLAILVDAETWTREVIRGLALEEAAWSERMRIGLWAILCLAEREPALARICLVETQRAGAQVQAERARILQLLAELVDEGRMQGGARGAAMTSLTAEALVGAISGVISTRLTHTAGQDAEAGMRSDLRALLGELTAMIVLPYVGPAATRRERNRPLPQTPAMDSPGTEIHTVRPDQFAGLTTRLTYRTVRVLVATAQLARDGSGASNKQIGDHAGISDQGQISKLLRRLQEHGLIVNAVEDKAGARGEANSWRLTSTGGRLAHGIATEASHARTTHEAVGKTRGTRRGCR